jgi:hypothetical protein
MLTILALKDNHSMKEFSAVGFSPKQHQHKSINSAILAFIFNNVNPPNLSTTNHTNHNLANKRSEIKQTSHQNVAN